MTMTDDTTMVTVSRSLLNELRGDIARLSATVDTITEELERRDIEQMELESAVEFLLDRNSTHLLTLGLLIRSALGDQDDKYGGASMMDRLYDGERHGAGFRQARYLTFRRPSRRWAQFGSKAELRAVAEAAGVKVRSDDRREDIIRQLWSHRADQVIPGGVGPYGGAS